MEKETQKKTVELIKKFGLDRKTIAKTLDISYSYVRYKMQNVDSYGFNEQDYNKIKAFCKRKNENENKYLEKL